MRRFVMRGVPFLAVVAGALGLSARPAAACGGLFCNSNQSQAVNQAAERIIFADNGDGTVTAVIEIMYEGRAQDFAWLLPVEGDPEVELSSSQVFDQLQQLTDPVYTLTRQVRGSCGGGTPLGARSESGSGQAPGASADAGAADSVTVVSSGAVGPYEYTTISVMAGLDDEAEVAIEWLEDNGYDVGDVGPEVLRPYLEDGLNLLAFRLSKDSNTGSIRPVRLTWEADLPSIPIRPTAVAANDNMGVMVFMTGRGRAIPVNYRSLELNEAMIDWFNPQRNYGDVVNRAADEAGGHGFVTEFSGDTVFLRSVIFGTDQRRLWNDFQGEGYSDRLQMLRDAFLLYGTWDGFDDALRAAVTPDDPDLIATAINCGNCPSASDVDFSPGALVEALFIHVIEPVLATHDLLTDSPKITRLYTTMSGDEMTVDPVFDLNNDLPDVSNQHNATQVILCDSDVRLQDARWRIELPSGDVVHGAGSSQQWPDEIDDQPANARVMQLAARGAGMVVEDNRVEITEELMTLRPREESGLCSASPGGARGGLWPAFGLVAWALAARRRRARAQRAR